MSTVSLRPYLSAVTMLVLISINVGVGGQGRNERRREIGVRMAVGAKPGDVVRLVMREGTLLVSGGLLAGIPAALASAQLMRSLLFGVGPSDPHIYVAVTVVLMTVAAGAIVVPAVRAVRIDPVSTLRAD